MNNVDRSKVFESGEEFFLQDGSGVMKLSGAAAFKVFELASQKGLAVSRVEGFIWHKSTGKFEARLDAIFYGLTNPVGELESIRNNEKAKVSTEEDISLGHDVFIVTIA
ncbi:colicin immunity protein [Pseudomonas gingeri]|uniref:colicin immunity protein n=1 Tax=Pseudomonas gingeri TaxID=117681 RepID=UPI00159FA2C1|nr:colicin immunity protein [Pseudomonas gingeri]NWA08609.1 colicin immunity protein [Pseudomonas gingeri]